MRLRRREQDNFVKTSSVRRDLVSTLGLCYGSAIQKNKCWLCLASLLHCCCSVSKNCPLRELRYSHRPRFLSTPRLREQGCLWQEKRRRRKRRAAWRRLSCHRPWEVEEGSPHCRCSTYRRLQFNVYLDSRFVETTWRTIYYERRQLHYFQRWKCVDAAFDAHLD